MRFWGGVVFEINRGVGGGSRGEQPTASVENSPGCPTLEHHSYTKPQNWLSTFLLRKKCPKKVHQKSVRKKVKIDTVVHQASKLIPRFVTRKYTVGIRTKSDIDWKKGFEKRLRFCGFLEHFEAFWGHFEVELLLMKNGDHEDRAGALQRPGSIRDRRQRW